ncbi:MAG: DUF4058 family protein [Alkalinema sp. FL-bin-369]|nr:DUF4058 family protein [Leptolyngbyaceae cyanobacterium LF-bin-369]
MRSLTAAVIKSAAIIQTPTLQNTTHPILPNSFPGMNPYLESPALWSEDHSWLIVELALKLDMLGSTLIIPL